MGENVMKGQAAKLFDSSSRVSGFVKDRGPSP